MSTLAAIGIEMPNGTVRAIGLQYAGYPAHAGVILAGYYRDQKKVEALIALGGLDTIGLDVNSEETAAYNRDMEGEFFDPKEFRNAEAFWDCAEDYFQAVWLYLYQGGKWYCKGYSDTEVFELDAIFENDNKKEK